MSKTDIKIFVLPTEKIIKEQVVIPFGGREV